MDTTPVSLLERLRGPDDSEAWQHFNALYRPLFLAWARRLNVPPAEADDLVQEVMVVLIGHLPQFERQSAGSFRSWLRTITRNKWLELQRRRSPLRSRAAPRFRNRKYPIMSKSSGRANFVNGCCPGPLS